LCCPPEADKSSIGGQVLDFGFKWGLPQKKIKEQKSIRLRRDYIGRESKNAKRGIFNHSRGRLCHTIKAGLPGGVSNDPTSRKRLRRTVAQVVSRVVLR
jgi:hypothetical protein